MAHGGFLRQHSEDPELASHIMHDYKTAGLDPETGAMLDYAAKLTRAPGDMEKADVERLRDVGLSDEQILSVLLVTCTFNFMTRLADGLNVNFSPERQEQTEEWLTGPARDQAWLMQQKSD
ncbi:MAG: hypothetical protein O2812_01085 [Chloroflexi bacterium]|nr:hypothetical protein [Chloroflexota bacterium]